MPTLSRNEVAAKFGISTTHAAKLIKSIKGEINSITGKNNTVWYTLTDEQLESITPRKKCGAKPHIKWSNEIFKITGIGILKGNSIYGK